MQVNSPRKCNQNELETIKIGSVTKDEQIKQTRKHIGHKGSESTEAARLDQGAEDRRLSHRSMKKHHQRRAKSICGSQE